MTRLMLGFQWIRGFLQLGSRESAPAIDGIIDEANEIASEVEDKMVLNAALIAAAQAVEHYEITRYGTLVAWARLLGHSGVARVLTMNLKEEKATDKKLNGRQAQDQLQGGCATAQAVR